MKICRSLPLVSAFTLGLLVAGCGSKSENQIAGGTVTDPDTGERTEYSVTADGDGEAGNVTIKTDKGELRLGGTADTKLPEGITSFPGSALKAGYTATGADGSGGLVSYEAPGKAGDVIAYYRKQIEAAGMKVDAQVTSGAMMMISARAPDGGNGGIHITANQDGGIVKGAIVFGNGS